MRSPVVIVGAPRSGTNMLRDLLASLAEFTTWPCDEINPIWRHGNIHVPHDELSREHARPEVTRFIRHAFERREEGARRVLEKTCATSLRVSFVDEVLPEAQYILIIRDGRDAAASALRRWRAPTDLGYTLRKARFVPPADLPHYALGWLRRRAERLFSSREHLSTWGPRFEGMDAFLSEFGVAATCAEQWARCVERSVADLRAIDPDRWFVVRYETFVRSPESEMRRIMNFLRVSRTTPLPDLSGVRTGDIGRGWKQLDTGAREEMCRHIARGEKALESIVPDD